MIWGWFGPKDMFEYYLGVFNGQGRNHGYNDDAKSGMYAGRIAINPIGRPVSFQESYVGMRSRPLPSPPSMPRGTSAKSGSSRKPAAPTFPTS